MEYKKIEGEIIKFLRDSANQIEDGSIEDKKLMYIVELYLQTKFACEENSFEDKDLMKYMSLGWYIYSMRDGVHGERNDGERNDGERNDGERNDGEEGEESVEGENM